MKNMKMNSIETRKYTRIFDYFNFSIYSNIPTTRIRITRIFVRRPKYSRKAKKKTKLFNNRNNYKLNSPKLRFGYF